MNEYLKKILAMIPEDKKTTTDEAGKTLQDLIDNMESTIASSESKKTEAIQSRDDAKSKLQAIAKKVGVTYDTAADFEKLEAALDAKKPSGKGDDEAWVKEKETLQAEITSLKTSLEDTKTTSEKEKMELILDRDLGYAMPKYKARDKMSKFLRQEIMAQASFEDDKVVFKNEDGTTLRINNENATIDSILAKMREDEIEAKDSVFFDTSAKQSGPGSNQGGVAGEDDFVPGS